MPVSEPPRRSPRLTLSPPPPPSQPPTKPSSRQRNKQLTKKQAPSSSPTMLVEALTLRRSPRLSLSPTPHQPTEPKSGGERTIRLMTKQALALALCDDPVEADPQPLKIFHPKSSKTQKLHLLHASSSSAKRALRRSPRLLGASVGVANGQCGSELLLKMPEKRACELARSCLDDNELNLKCLRSRNLRAPSHLASSASGSGSTTLAALDRKRKLDSGQYSDETPAKRKSLRQVCGDSSALALPSSSTAVNSGKSKKLDSRRNSDETLVNRGFPRRSPRFSGEIAGETFPNKDSNDDGKRKLVRQPEDVPLALPSSSMMKESAKLRKLDSWKKLEFSDKVPENAEFRRQSPSFSDEAIESPIRKELIDKSERHPVRFSGEKAVESSACSEFVSEARGRSEQTPLPSMMRSVMEEIFGKIEEETVLRRSPRGLSSICLVDDYECDEMKELGLPSSKKKKKKEQEKATKERRDKSKVSGCSTPSIDKEKETESKSCFFVGEAVPDEEAHRRWGWRYQLK